MFSTARIGLSGLPGLRPCLLQPTGCCRLRTMASQKPPPIPKNRERTPKDRKDTPKDRKDTPKATPASHSERPLIQSGRPPTGLPNSSSARRPFKRPPVSKMERDHDILMKGLNTLSQWIENQMQVTGELLDQARHANATSDLRRYEYDMKRHWVNLESVGHGQRMVSLMLDIVKIPITGITAMLPRLPATVPQQSRDIRFAIYGLMRGELKLMFLSLLAVPGRRSLGARVLGLLRIFPATMGLVPLAFAVPFMFALQRMATSLVEDQRKQ